MEGGRINQTKEPQSAALRTYPTISPGLTIRQEQSDQFESDPDAHDQAIQEIVPWYENLQEQGPHDDDDPVDEKEFLDVHDESPFVVIVE